MNYFGIIFILLICYESYEKDVYVNINMDLLPNITHIKVCNTFVNIPGCPELENLNNATCLRLSTNLTSKICSNGNLTFHVFTFYTNISSAIITVKNQNYSWQEIKSNLSVISRDVIILDVQSEHASFVICKTSRCQYSSTDNRMVLKNTNMVLYSACNGTNGYESCLTNVEFLSEMNDIDHGSEIIGSRIQIKMSNLEPVIGLPLKCRNGGIIESDLETQTLKCTCPRTKAFIVSGPQCEAMQVVIDKPQFLYYLPNTKNLYIEFQIISSSYFGRTDIFKIENADGTVFMKYEIHGINHKFTFLNHSIVFNSSLNLMTPTSDVLIHVSKNGTTIRFNQSVVTILDQHPVLDPILLDAHPFIVGSTEQPRDSQLCLSNLKINSQIVDLYLPVYSACALDECLETCSEKEMCIFVPFSTGNFARCICKYGFIRYSTNDLCVKNSNTTGQLTKNMYVALDYNIKMIHHVAFKFRTLMQNGNLMTLNLTSHILYVGISNGKIYLTILKAHNTTEDKVILYYYNVSDGWWHTIQIHIKSYYIEITLDERIPYSSNTTWIQGIINNLNGISLGALYATNPKHFNLTTCFDSLQLRYGPWGSDIIYEYLGNHLISECSSGVDCITLNCTNNTTCSNGWQNSSCVCKNGFSDLNGKCFFTKCLSNPCQNEGECFYDTQLNDYRCQCKVSFSGYNCEVLITEGSFPLWIALVAIAVFLIILIVILCFLCRKNISKAKDFSDINEIYQNTASYSIQAGEADYEGPPVNIYLLMEAINSKESISKDKEIYDTKEMSKANLYSTPFEESLITDLLNQKEHHNINDDDIIIDHPLEYGFEGFDSDGESVSSFDSTSFN